MLPFLKKHVKQSGVIVSERKPDQPHEVEQAESEDYGLEACASDVMQAIEMKDKKALADAMKAFFQIVDSMPHEEGEHIEAHSYDAQNAKAAKD